MIMALIHLGAYIILLLEKPFRQPADSVSKSHSVNKILLIQTKHLGDMLLALPAINEARQKYPQAKISLLVGSWNRDLIKHLDWIEEVIIFDAPWLRRQKSTINNQLSTINLIRQLRQRHFDLAYDLGGDFYSNLILWRARIANRIGLCSAGRRFLTQCQPVNHQEPRCLNLLKIINPTTEEKDIDFKWRFLPTDKIRVNRFLAHLRQGFGGQVVAIHPVSPVAAKNWPLEYWQKVVDWLMEKKCQVILMGTQAEKDIQPDIFPPRRQIIDCRGEFNVRETIYLLSKIDLFIGGDSAPGHFAALVKISQISIFSIANEPAKWRPFNQRAILLKHQVACQNCQLFNCPKNNLCLRQISPTEVITVIKRTNCI